MLSKSQKMGAGFCSIYREIHYIEVSVYSIHSSEIWGLHYNKLQTLIHPKSNQSEWLLKKSSIAGTQHYKVNHILEWRSVEKYIVLYERILNEVSHDWIKFNTITERLKSVKKCARFVSKQLKSTYRMLKIGR